MIVSFGRSYHAVMFIGRNRRSSGTAAPKREVFRPLKLF